MIVGTFSGAFWRPRIYFLGRVSGWLPGGDQLAATRPRALHTAAVASRSVRRSSRPGDDALLLPLFDPVFRASSASDRDGRRRSSSEALILFLDPLRRLIRCFSAFYLNSRGYAIYTKLFSAYKSFRINVHYGN